MGNPSIIPAELRHKYGFGDLKSLSLNWQNVMLERDQHQAILQAFLH